ncbi:MAG TPA: DUF362 domain-containing protein [Terriglobales bacterium]|nr:DUF362 domain-containing protein [Terriglobales bacterium]
MDQTSDTSRRDFLKKCVMGTAVLRTAKLPLLGMAGQESTPGKSKVVIANDAQLRGAKTTVDSSRIASLLDRAMQSLFDLDDPIEPWKKLVRAGQRVGVKVNALGGRGLSSNVQLVEAICERLQEAGIRGNDTVIWDRDTEELERAGFHVATAGNRVQCFGSDRLGYEERLATYGSVGSRLSKILTQRSDVLINVPVLKDHDGAGVTIALKNMYGVIHNPNKYHPNGCNPYIADVNMLPEIRSKMRLTICDATTASYEGGPGYKPQYSWKNDGLIISQDPVALDYIGWQIIERKRAEKGLKTLEGVGRSPAYIATAADAGHRLGMNDPRRIATVEV